MKRSFIVGISFLSIILFIGCGASNPTVATVGDEKITLHTFEDNYARTNGGWDTSATSSLEDRQKFLDLFVKFKLKVKEARSLGLEKDSAIISEMNSYSGSVAKSYMLEKDIVEPGVKQLYNRKKEEVRASHMLFRLPPNPKPADTLKAYEQAMSALAQIPQVSFDTLAFKFSQDPSAKENYGDLGFFAGGRMVPEFEDACYSMKPGEYTKTPIRTQYGYHILKVTARQPNSGSVRISHIILRFNEEMTDTAEVRDTVWMIYNKLKRGANFQEMMKKYSQDPQSNANNGDIGFYERERLPQRVANIFYQLKIDSISEPMFFNYGYHIFKLTEKKALPSFEEMQNDLKTQYKQVRYQHEYQQYAQNLKVKYKVVIDSLTVQKLIASLDTNKIVGNGDWKDTLSAETLKLPLIHSSGRPFTVNDFTENVIMSTEFKNIVLSPINVWILVNKMLDAAALGEHARYATERYPILVQLLDEYKEAILLYRIEQDEVWNRVMVNDSLLKEYYQSHKESYRWPERVNFAEIYTTSDSVAKAAYRQVKQGKDFMDIAQKNTNRPGYQDKKGVWGLQTFTFNELSLKASTMAVDSVTAPFKFQSGWSIIKVLGKDSAQVKSFEEALPEVTSGYQDIASKKREQEWVDTLKNKYPVTIDKEALTQAFKRKRVEY